MVTSKRMTIIERLNARHRVLLAAEQDPIMEEIRHLVGDLATSFSAGEVSPAGKPLYPLMKTERPIAANLGCPILVEDDLDWIPLF